MAYKLYPPTLAGTVPPFYQNSDGTSALLEVPFLMNKTVSASSFSTMMLRIRDASTDVDFGAYLSTSITFGQVNIARWDLGKIAASTGGKSTSLANRLVIGNYYKI